MRYLLFVFALFATPAWAQQQCATDVLVVESWSIEPIDERSNTLTVVARYEGSTPIRMLDASVQFSDVLGGRIASYAVTRDLTLGPGEQFEQTGRWGLNTFERLLDLDPDDVVVTTCVRVAISDEGERIEFSEEPGLRSEQPTNNNVEIRGAAFMLAMAAACPTNDNQLAIDAAQSIFDDAGYTDYAAADMFDTLKRSAESEEAGNPALACGLLERALE